MKPSLTLGQRSWKFLLLQAEKPITKKAIKQAGKLVE